MKSIETEDEYIRDYADFLRGLIGELDESDVREITTRPVLPVRHRGPLTPPLKKKDADE